MIQRILLSIFILNLVFSCSDSQKTDENQLDFYPELLSESPYTYGNFSFQVPLDWKKVENESAEILVFFNEQDSSTLLVGLESPDVEEFGDPKMSDFTLNEINFSQKVFQTEYMYFYSVKTQKSIDSLTLFYAVPTKHFPDKKQSIESSLSSITYITD